MRVRRPRVLAGLLVAAMLTAALTGILFFARRVAGLPFVPFDTFDWLTRVLPGRLIAFGIGTMVSVIRLLNLGPISSTAKAAEQANGDRHSVHRGGGRGPHCLLDSS